MTQMTIRILVNTSASTKIPTRDETTWYRKALCCICRRAFWCVKPEVVGGGTCVCDIVYAEGSREAVAIVEEVGGNGAPIGIFLENSPTVAVGYCAGLCAYVLAYVHIC
eukprot:GHVS01010988.1.p1 GENE.GHVS01010988.1~~GHVS01010988.1.p1  ORF type:complete len:109 (-),score=9.20 GHVS01010988.1:28-354(-)